MAKKVKSIVARDSRELADVLGLAPADAVEWELRHRLTNKIIETAERNRLTVSKIAKTSRARVTNVLKGDS